MLNYIIISDSGNIFLASIFSYESLIMLPNLFIIWRRLDYSPVKCIHVLSFLTNRIRSFCYIFKQHLLHIFKTTMKCVLTLTLIYHRKRNVKNLIYGVDLVSWMISEVLEDGGVNKSFFIINKKAGGSTLHWQLYLHLNFESIPKYVQRAGLNLYMGQFLSVFKMYWQEVCDNLLDLITQ